MRNELLNAIAGEVRSYHQRVEYDYVNVRRRLIFEALTQGVHYVYNNAVEGEIAEFGTASGFSAFTIARAMGIYQEVFAGYLQEQGVPRRALHLFDSFAGLPAPSSAVDLASPYVRAGRWKQGTFNGLDQAELHALCSAVYEAQRIHVVPGFYAESLPRLPSAMRFAMVHLDCDLYSSTAEVLEALLSRRMLSEGAVLFFDDWNCNRSSPRFGQRRAWGEAVEKYGLRFSDCGDYAVLGHKFIVHIERG